MMNFREYKRIIAQICYSKWAWERIAEKGRRVKDFLENSCMESTGSFQVKNPEFQTFQVDMALKQSEYRSL